MLVPGPFLRGRRADGAVRHPEEFEGHGVPEVLLSGDHGAIERWRLKQALGSTWTRRRDLLEQKELTPDMQKLLDEYLSEYDKENDEAE